jgi:hypothetical protein
MSGYVVACYGITIASLTAYSAWAIVRLRAVTKRSASPK